jgi:hypothetical protein
VFSIEKHLGEYTLGEILLGKDFKLNVGNGRRPLFEDKWGLMSACRLTMLDISCMTQAT